MLANLTKRDDGNAVQDVLVVLSDNGTADIVPVIEINEDRILAAAGEVEYAVPIGMAKVYMGRRGRIYSLPATADIISDTTRIAALERSTVLRQITVFEKERMGPAGKLPLGKLLLAGAVVLVIIIVLAVKK